MNSTLFLSFLRQRFTSPARLALMFLVFVFPLAMVAATHGGAGFQPLGTGTMFAFVLGAGMIGNDVSSGVFQLLFARPVSRFEYLISRWLAVGVGAALLNAVQVLLAATIMAGNHSLDSWTTVLVMIGEQCAGALVVSAIIACFSSVLPGIGDVVAIFAAGLVLTMANGAVQFAHLDVAAHVIQEIQHTISPDVSFGQMFFSGHIAWSPIVTAATSLVGGLALAAIALDGKEITYASG